MSRADAKAVHQLLDEVDEEEATAEDQFRGRNAVKVIAGALEALTDLGQHVDKAGGHQDAAAEAQQHRGDGSLPEALHSSRVIRLGREVDQGAELERHEAEGEGDPAEQQQRHQFDRHQIHLDVRHLHLTTIT